MANVDITKPVDLYTHAEGTGHRRLRRPVYMDFMPPCNSACPAGENIQAWLSLAQAGDYAGAFQKILEENPFPAIMGRVCVRPCETGCNRNHIDTTVNIHAVERFIGDEAIRNNWPVKFSATPSGKKVLVVGAGPAGLSAAYHLTRMGHTVTIAEAGAQAGGLLWSGIPEYRLPKGILEAEVLRILNMGIHLQLGRTINDVWKEKEAEGYDAVFVAIGARRIHQEPFEHDQSVLLTNAFSFFEDAHRDAAPYTRKKVLVYGGGKLALYIARIIKRFSSDAFVYFPGDKKMMPAYDYETDDALAEGVDLSLLRRIHKIEKKQVILEILKVENGKMVGTGTYESVTADVVIDANKQESDSGLLRHAPGVKINEDGTVVVDAQRATGCAGIFAGGDMLPGENRSATIAIGQGKKAARNIDSYLKQEAYRKPDKHPTAGYRKLHMWYKTEAPQQEQNRLAPAVAITSFDEVIAGLTAEKARYEAQRCLSCGNCFECDGCYGACPEDAIIKRGKGNRYAFNYNACTGCAVCFEQCPCHAIEMIPEPVNTTADVNR